MLFLTLVARPFHSPFSVDTPDWPPSRSSRRSRISVSCSAYVSFLTGACCSGPAAGAGGEGDAGVPAAEASGLDEEEACGLEVVVVEAAAAALEVRGTELCSRRVQPMGRTSRRMALLDDASMVPDMGEGSLVVVVERATRRHSTPS